jgi:Mrp family chromosome partitioning ATPase/capsular polysaccharide biosynthesis protein
VSTVSTPLNLDAALRIVGWPVAIVALSVFGGLAGAQVVTAMVTPTYEARASVVVAAYTPGGSAGATAPTAAPTPESSPASRPSTASPSSSASPRTSPGDTASPSGSPARPTSRSSAEPEPAAAGNGTRAAPERTMQPEYRATLSKMMVPTVARYAESTTVARATAAKLGLPDEDVVGHIDATHEADVQVVTLTTTASTAARAAAIANTATDILARQIASGGPISRRGALAAEPFERAVPPSSPQTPDRFLALVLGGILGLVGGVGLATLFRRFDDRLRTTEEITAELGLAVLGCVPRVHGWQLRAGARMAFRRRPVARSIRTTLASLTPVNDPPGRRILVTSSFADDGKTFVSGLLALGLAEQRYHVTLLEGQLRHPALARHFPASAEQTIQRLLGTDEELAASAGVALRVLAAEPTDPEVSRALLRSKSFIHLVDTAASQSDVVVINGPGVLASGDIAPLSAQADTVILVVRAGTTRAGDARRALEVLRRLNVPIAGVVVTDAVDSGVPRARRPAATPFGTLAGEPWSVPGPPPVQLPAPHRDLLAIGARPEPAARREVGRAETEVGRRPDIGTDEATGAGTGTGEPVEVGASSTSEPDRPAATDRARSGTSEVTVSS